MYYQTQRLSPYVKGLIAANVVVFVAQMIPRAGDVVTLLGGIIPGLTFLHFQLWRLVSYMFLHDVNTLFHILFNMLALWWFGAELEDLWGGKKFLLFYFICGIGAGLFSLFYLIVDPTVLVIGASGAVLAVLTAYAHYYPDRQVLLFFIMPMRMRTLVIGYAVISVLLSFTGGGKISHITHLGGIVMAALYLKIYPIARMRAGQWVWKMKKRRR